MIIKRPSLFTKLEIWSPRYSSKYSEGEWVALLAKYKVEHASSVILIEFTKAKHLKGQRFCITKDKVQHSPIDTNGKIECYAVPMSEFESWDTSDEVRDLANNIFEE